MSDPLGDFFRKATQHHIILPYQRTYASDPFSLTLLRVPTGLGKTDAAIVPWLEAVSRDVPGTPRRLVYVLPRRNLTQQILKRARQLVNNSGLAGKVDLLELMGSSPDNRRTPAPERYTILVGTQDLLISRALNRGYARRPPRWPIDFGLLSNSVHWILDEVQLTADSLATSTQLAAFRERFGTFGKVSCLWMSATARPEWLHTVDFHQKVREIELTDEDRNCRLVHERIYAPKALARAPESCRLPQGCAAFALEQHRPGERTLIIANTVARAREIASELRKLGVEPLVLHSRFRPAERERIAAALEREDQIIVSTQVLEAGIDLNAHRLITDLAPWGALVQRFGRVNRRGELPHSEIWWVDRPLSSKRKALATAAGLKPKDLEELARPYAQEDLRVAAEKLEHSTSAAPADLPEEDGPAPWRHVLRKADLLDLFDTSPDLSGNEVDVSRFIRAGEDKDCYLAWRDWKTPADLDDKFDIDDTELCPVLIGDVLAFAKTHQLARWDFVSRQWKQVRPKDPQLWPGLILVAQAKQGGYTEAEGWNPESRQAVPVVPVAKGSPADGDDDDHLSRVTYRQTLADHTRMVVEELQRILDALSDSELNKLRPGTGDRGPQARLGQDARSNADHASQRRSGDRIPGEAEARGRPAASFGPALSP